jgi:hypothetical protein
VAELGVERCELKVDSLELKATARRAFYRREAENAEKDNGESFNTECTEKSGGHWERRRDPSLRSG